MKASTFTINTLHQRSRFFFKLNTNSKAFGVLKIIYYKFQLDNGRMVISLFLVCNARQAIYMQSARKSDIPDANKSEMYNGDAQRSSIIYYLSEVPILQMSQIFDFYLLKIHKVIQILNDCNLIIIQFKFNKSAQRVQTFNLLDKVPSQV